MWEGDSKGTDMVSALLLKVYLKGRGSNKDRQAFHLLVHASNTQHQPWLGQAKQEPGTPPGSAIWVAEIQLLEIFSAGVFTGSWH